MALNHFFYDNLVLTMWKRSIVVQCSSHAKSLRGFCSMFGLRFEALGQQSCHVIAVVFVDRSMVSSFMCNAAHQSSYSPNKTNMYTMNKKHIDLYIYIRTPHVILQHSSRIHLLRWCHNGCHNGWLGEIQVGTALPGPTAEAGRRPGRGGARCHQRGDTTWVNDDLVRWYVGMSEIWVFSIAYPWISEILGEFYIYIYIYHLNLYSEFCDSIIIQ